MTFRKEYKKIPKVQKLLGSSKMTDNNAKGVEIEATIGGFGII